MKQIIRLSAVFVIGSNLTMAAQQNTYNYNLPDPMVQNTQQAQGSSSSVVVIVQKDQQTPTPVVISQPAARETWEEQQKKAEEKVIAREQAAIDRAHNADLKQMAVQTRAFYVKSDTFLVTREQLVGEVRNRDGFKDLQLVQVDRLNAAEVVLTVDHIPFTFDYTYMAVDRKTTAVMAAGKITAPVGYVAAMELAHAFVNDMKKLREQESKKAEVKPQVEAKPVESKSTEKTEEKKDPAPTKADKN